MARNVEGQEPTALRSQDPDLSLELEITRRRPPPTGRDQEVSLQDSRRGHDQCIGQPQRTVRGPNGCRVGGNGLIERDNDNWHTGNELANNVDGLRPPPGRTDKGLSQR